MKFDNYFIIAEIGINHDGNFEKAKKLILSAKQNGADAVKFQYFQPNDLYLETNKNYEILKNLTISKKKLSILRNYAKKINIKFFCTPFSFEGIAFLKEISVDGFKIASMDNLNYSFIDNCCAFNSTVLVSTGMLNKIETDRLFKKYSKKVFFLHCVSNYPVKETEIGIEVLKYYQHKLKKKNFGYSDHFKGMDAVKIAMTKGAKIIEKHFTLEKRNFLDHEHSMDPLDLNQLNQFRKILNSKKNVNNFYKKRSDSKNSKIFRRGIYAKNKLMTGHKIKLNDVNYVRPLGNFKFIDLKEILGKKLKNNINENEKIFKKKC